MLFVGWREKISAWAVQTNDMGVDNIEDFLSLTHLQTRHDLISKVRVFQYGNSHQNRDVCNIPQFTLPKKIGNLPISFHQRFRFSHFVFANQLT